MMCRGAAPGAASGWRVLWCTGERGWKNTSGEHLGRNYVGINAGENFRLAVCFSTETIPGGWEETGRVSIAKSGSLRELPG